MPSPGFLLLAGLLAPSAPPGPAVGPPRLARGLELVYRGEVVEASDRIDHRFRKTSDLEIRVLVVEAGPASADCAVMTRVRPREDPAVAGAAVVVTGTDPARAPSAAAVRVEFVRVDSRGRGRLLRPPVGPPPVPLGPDVPTIPAPTVPLDGPPVLELGMFVPLPPAAVSVGDGWDVADPDRPPVGWKAARESVWNGGRCVELTAVQQSDGWDRPAACPTGWRRTDTVLAAPIDGFAATVVRRCEKRNGATVAGWVEVKYELRSPTRLLGTRYADARSEAEAGFCFAADPGPVPVTLAKIDRYLATHPTPTGYRDGVDAARRRCLAAARGEAVITAAAVVPVAPPEVGQPAPDFVAPAVGRSGSFRLSASRGRPVVVVFFKPGAGTTPGTLAVAEALHKTFADRAAVVAVTVGSDAVPAGLTVPVVDGAGVRERYGVDSYPRFVVVDAAGGLAWRFDGFGPETGYLAKQQVERLVSDASQKRP